MLGGCRLLPLADDPRSNTLFVWHGASANLREKTKALDTANAYRSNRGSMRVGGCGVRWKLWYARSQATARLTKIYLGTP